MRFNTSDVIALRAIRERKRDSRVSIGSYLAAVGEGFNKAEFYEWLARKSDAELAAFGVEREELPRVVMFGKDWQR